MRLEKNLNEKNRIETTGVDLNRVVNLNKEVSAKRSN